MTEDQKYEIAVLAEDYETKRRHWESLGLVNTLDKTASERMKLQITYQIADAQRIMALQILEDAKRGIFRAV